MSEINESEQKRIKSLKEKKRAFKTKELIVQNALKNLDKESTNNKIIFDEDVEQVVRQLEIKEKTKKRKFDLFDDDGNDAEDDEQAWDDSKFEIKKSKPMFPSGTFGAGNDDRFKLDKRFIENDEASNKDETQEADESGLEKEKEMQLDILENILGVPMTSKRKDANTESKVPKKGMIRYDPTKDNHKEYEIKTEKPSVDSKKVQKKKKVKTEDKSVTEDKPITVSKDIYFSVSESLTKSLKEEGQFSLLSRYGNVEDNEKESNNVSTTEPSKPPKFQFDFKSKNPFKYDSSDDEHDSKEVAEQILPTTNEVFEESNKFFFNPNDPRFNEAINFFSKKCVSDDNFQNLRRELKQIMRVKIRQNVKKAQPWGRKKSIKRITRKRS